MSRRPAHEPVLLEAVVSALRPIPDGTYVDGTLGAGGHARAILDKLGPEGRLIGIDRDPAALSIARTRLSDSNGRVVFVHGNHGDLLKHLDTLQIVCVDGILLDLGVSSMQLDDPERGFSFRTDGPLDMRMNPTSGMTAQEWLDSVDPKELARVLWSYGEEPRARAIARAICRKRPIRGTSELAEIVADAVGHGGPKRIHPATRTFQALRIAINGELSDLERTLREAAGVLRTGGRIVAISFHSLEDRIVKHTFRSLEARCTCPPKLPVCSCGRPGTLRVLTQRPIVADSEELAGNPRARSAKLRYAERIPG